KSSAFGPTEIFCGKPMPGTANHRGLILVHDLSPSGRNASMKSVGRLTERVCPANATHVLGMNLNCSESRRRGMGFGVRTGKPPDSGESGDVDHKEQWEFARTELPLLAGFDCAGVDGPPDR